MIDDAIIAAFTQIKKTLKQKYPDRFERIFYLLLIVLVTIIPLLLFNYWLGRISGLIVVSLFFIYLVFDSNKKNKNVKIP